MRKYILLILTVIHFSNSFAQPQPKWSVGLICYPRINDRIILPSENSQKYVDYRNDNETYMLGVDYGFNIQYRIAENWALRSGLIYSRKGYKTEEDRIIDPCFSPITCGYNTEFYTYEFKSMQLPLQMVWNKKIGNLISFEFLGGLMVDYRYENKVIYSLTGDSGKNTEKEISRDFDGNINSFDVLATLGVGINIRLIGNIDFSIIPSVNFSLIPVKNEDIKNHIYNINLFKNVSRDNKEILYTAGLSIGLRYNLFAE